RLDRYGAGRRMDFDSAGPDAIADAIAEEIDRPVDYRPVETDGARRAAEKLAELLQSREPAPLSPTLLAKGPRRSAWPHGRTMSFLVVPGLIECPSKEETR